MIAPDGRLYRINMDYNVCCRWSQVSAFCILLIGRLWNENYGDLSSSAVQHIAEARHAYVKPLLTLRRCHFVLISHRTLSSEPGNFFMYYNLTLPPL